MFIVDRHCMLMWTSHVDLVSAQRKTSLLQFLLWVLIIWHLASDHHMFYSWILSHCIWYAYLVCILYISNLESIIDFKKNMHVHAWSHFLLLSFADDWWLIKVCAERGDALNELELLLSGGVCCCVSKRRWRCGFHYVCLNAKPCDRLCLHPHIDPPCLGFWEVISRNACFTQVFMRFNCTKEQLLSSMWS